MSTPAPKAGQPETPCPICGRPADPKRRPFCSVRCADVDLGRWLTDSYAIPVRDDETDDPDGAGGQGDPA